MPYFTRSTVSYDGVNLSSSSILATGDFNGDGHQDIVLMFSLLPLQDVSTPFRVLLGDGAGGFTDGTALLFPGGAPGSVSPRDVVVADFNGDGRADIFVADHGYDASPFPGEQNRLLLSSGEHGLIDASGTLPQVDDFTHSAAAGDIDGDGDLDVLAMNISGGTPSAGVLTDPYFLINDGDGNFAREDTYLPADIRIREFGFKFTSSLLFDADADGDLDLFLGSHGETATNYSLLLYNEGMGNFADAERANLPVPEPWGQAGSAAVDVQALDLNGDGRLDLVVNYAVANYDSHYIQFLINDGSGGWIDETQERLPQPASASEIWFRNVEVVDLNGDGHEDLMVRGGGTGQPILLNDGSGRFVVLPASFLDISGYFGVDWTVNYAVVDANGDGRLDIVADVGANTQSGEYTMFLFTQQDPGPAQAGTASADALLGDSSDEALDGAGGDDVLFGGAGADTIAGGAGADTMVGGAGNDIFHGTAAELSGDTIRDLSVGDRIVVTNATLGSFSYSLSGEMLTYSGGAVSLAGGVTGYLIASAAAEGGVQLVVSNAPPPPPPVVRAKLILTQSGQDVTIGGAVAVLGTTAGGEVIEVVRGDVTLDASFNAGGDTVVLPGNAGSYSAVLSGSFVTIAGAGVSVAIPVGTAGLAVQFADSTRMLEIEDNQVVLGSQQITATQQSVAASGPPLTDAVETGPDSFAKLIVTASGQDVDVGGNVSILGTASPGEVVTVLGGTVQLDASFNAGGDTVVLPGASGDYTATLAGSFVTITDGELSVAIPVGVAGLTVGFADANLSLRIDTATGTVRLGDTVVTTAGVSVEAAASIEVGKDAELSMADLGLTGLKSDLNFSLEIDPNPMLEIQRIEIIDSFSFA